MARNVQAMRLLLSVCCVLFGWTGHVQLVAGQVLQSETCNSEANANYNGTLLNNQTATSLGDCCYRCGHYPGCNIYVFCPLAEGCDNGYGIPVQPYECNLKRQDLASNSQAAISAWSRGSATQFSSGQTGPLSFAPPPPPPKIAPTIAPPIAPSIAPGPPTTNTTGTQSSQPSPTSASSSSTGAIVGGVVGGVVGAAAIITVLGFFLGWWPCCKKRQNKDPELGHKAPPRNYFDTGLQKHLDGSKETELAEFNMAFKPAAMSSASNTSDASTPGAARRDKEGLPDTYERQQQIKAHNGIAPVGKEGVLGADALLARVGSMAGQAAVGVAFADDEAEQKLHDDGVHSTWKIEPRDLQCKLRDGVPIKLGQGGCGTVYWGVLYGMREVAIKVINNPDAKQQARFVREIMMLKACHDPNIVQFLGAAIHKEQTLLVMTYMPGGDLYGQMAKDTAGNFKWHQRGRSIALDIIKGLSFLHRHRIMHLDIKSPNILLTSNWEARIADVGLGKMSADKGSIATQGASYMWAAPEQLIGEPCTAASDIYALGVVIWELCTGEQPRGRLCRAVEPTEAPQPVRDLIARCRAFDPAARPSIAEVYRIVEYQG